MFFLCSSDLASWLRVCVCVCVRVCGRGGVLFAWRAALLLRVLCLLFGVCLSRLRVSSSCLLCCCLVPRLLCVVFGALFVVLCVCCVLFGLAAGWFAGFWPAGWLAGCCLLAQCSASLLEAPGLGAPFLQRVQSYSGEECSS